MCSLQEDSYACKTYSSVLQKRRKGRKRKEKKKKTGLSLWENGLDEEAKALDIVSTIIAPLKMTSSPRKTSFRPMHDGKVGGERIN